MDDNIICLACKAELNPDVRGWCPACGADFTTLVRKHEYRRMGKSTLARKLAATWLRKHRQYREQYNWHHNAGEHRLAAEADECSEAASVIYQALTRTGDIAPWVKELQADKEAANTAHAKTVYDWGIESLQRLGED
jgi:predicted RNA-binding Zn-ribbon protein involved in translation (DUF1610 family)